MELQQQGAILAQMQVQPSWVQEVAEAQNAEAQKKDAQIALWVKQIQADHGGKFRLDSNGVWFYADRIVVPQTGEVRQKILHEAHNSPYTMHPGSTKMYQDLKKDYWWPGMKRDIGDVVTRCLTCQQSTSKSEIQLPSGLLHPITCTNYCEDGIRSTRTLLTGLPQIAAEA
ncbi:uncharacterized protein LOC119370287 [Jatropha curcas]|uniref:uncharacterized protein LOC119370287 n=1 Tax=Jatropha curcas TaxID=180498 RepID=UPI001893F1A0|nr:uncharacterized protein LOC119370287 [Jatropha curcas]